MTPNSPAETHINKPALLKRAFSDLSPEELNELSELTVIRQYAPGHVLCREGAYEDVFYILAQGEAAITMTMGEAGNQRLLRVAKPGDYFGEMALIQNTTRAASIVTTTEAVTLEMSKAEFELALRQSPRLAFNIMHAIIDRLRSNDQGVIAELQSVNEVLKKLDRNKTEFIEVAAHELRTPLTVMTGYTRILGMDSALRDNPMLQEVVKGILKGSERMLEVVNAMLDVTRLTGGTVVVSPSPVMLRSMVRQLVNNLKNDLETRNLTIHQEHGDDVPVIQADPKLIEKALQHLITNAMKYTPDGREIFIRTEMRAMADGGAGAVVIVQDTGIGIDPDQHELIFEKFYQVGDSKTHSSGQTSFKGGGPGMGLAIVKGVAEAHGGQTWVESEKHDEDALPGSTFYLLLPVEAREPNTLNNDTLRMDRPLFTRGDGQKPTD